MYGITITPGSLKEMNKIMYYAVCLIKYDTAVLLFVLV